MEEDNVNDDESVEVIYIIEDNDDSALPVDLHQIKVEIEEEPKDTNIDTKTFPLLDYDAIKYEVEITNESEAIACTICNKEFEDFLTLKEHTESSTKCRDNIIDESSIKQDNTCDTTDEGNHVGEVSHDCKVCTKSFGNCWFSNRHKRKHDEDKKLCNFCDMSFNCKDDLEKHKNVHKVKKPYSCNLCKKSFVFLSALTRHKLSIHPEKKYFCNECGVVYNDENSFIFHKRTHATKKEFACNLCDRSFDYKASLASHKRKHIPVKPYNCDECCMSFSYFGNFVIHKKMHAGENPYYCDICSTSFKFRGELYLHKQKYNGMKIYCNSALKENHEKMTMMGPYRCDLCDLTFIDKKLLKSHEQTFKHFTCSICGNGYFLEANLRAHKRTHLANKL